MTLFKKSIQEIEIYIEIQFYYIISINLIIIIYFGIIAITGLPFIASFR